MILIMLIALDDFNTKNGTLEIAKKHNGSFKDLLKNTKKWNQLQK